MSALFHPFSGDRLRIVAVGFHGLRDLLEELAPQHSTIAEVSVLDKAYSDAVADIVAMRAFRPVDAVVSAGSNGSYLRQHLDLPVVLVKAGGLDIMRGLARASRNTTHIALVTYGDIAPEVRHFCDTFGLSVALRSYTTEEDAEACVQELKAQGVQAIVAPGLVVDLARACGLEGVLLYSQGAVREAMDDAIEVARISRLEASRREKLNTILGKLKDGVVAVNMDERIETINPSMEALIGLPATQLIGQRLSEVSGALGLQQTLRSGDTESEQVEEVGGKTVVVTRMPIIEQGRQTGAVLVCQDPVAIQRLDRNLRSRAQPRANITKYSLDHLVGQSQVIREVRARALTCAQSDATVLIIGESGTGKELLAQGIHHASARRAQPFVAVNCAAFPESLLESELFGYVEGAFTGSSRGGKVGLFEAAHTGTIFLDEIGEMPPSLQTRLLRVLQEKEVLRLGSTEPTPVDVRIIAATHRDLNAQVQTGGFRRDLFYRLNILLIKLPSLRERKDDLPLLARHLQEKVAQRLRYRKPGDDSIVAAIVGVSRHYDWPGNIRELENLIERTLVFRLPSSSSSITADEILGIAPELFTHQGRLMPADASVVSGVSVNDAFKPLGREATEYEIAEREAIRREAAGYDAVGREAVWHEAAGHTAAQHGGGLHKDAGQGGSTGPAFAPQTQGLRHRRSAAEMAHIKAVLDACHGNREAAAARLNISRTTLWRKLKQLDEEQ